MNVLNCCRKTKRPWLKVIHPCPLKTTWMNVKLSFKSHSGSKLAYRRFLHYLSAGYKPPARAEEKQSKSLEWLKKQMLSINVTATSPDLPLLLSITNHLHFSSQTIDTQKGRDAFIEGQGYLWTMMNRNGPLWTCYVF